MSIFVAQLLISLDGRNANDSGAPDAEEHEEFNQLFARSDRIVFDRADYETLVPYWDDVDIADPAISDVERDFARIFRAKPRIVVAPDLEQVDPMSELIGADPIARLSAIRQEGHGTILVSAGAGLLTTLLGHRLIDELHVVMRPCLLGGDDSPLNGLLQHTPLALLESRALASGTLILRYRVQDAPAETARTVS